MTYREILEQFKNEVAGTRAVIFCDHEGEAIEFVSEFDSYHTQLFGAYQSELVMTMRQLGERLLTGNVQTLQVHSDNAVVTLWPIGRQYYVAVMSKQRLPLSHPSIRRITRLLEAEI